MSQLNPKMNEVKKTNNKNPIRAKQTQYKMKVVKLAREWSRTSHMLILIHQDIKELTWKADEYSADTLT